ncbi:hypothetical protein CH64_1599 [Yersinia rohdei]|uniref:Putative inner membrane protein n=1 Tax=Yersinia rohdei TaxID=29485 RepID=A0A0U1HTX5_YERRO|nr:DUF883 family protein [Yersinia rohdei]AJJ09071.1 hypothetical protein CH64_1599 [Yersinia rohdei]EEQ03617.1 hypothetical protein yrohd0001_21830 [Yersinia rohdei ATCC 43380]MDN0096744.1 DUF883 family protein [Yersinia rohdei]OWF77066.1 hypothetical protein B4900_17685 [Yersinia rohdei]CNE92753.1 putative inner membrane protein [Yersinia rohdei]
MFKKSEKVARDLSQDVALLTETLDDVLRSSGEKSKEELAKVRQNAEGVLRDARARFLNSPHLKQHARDVANNANHYVHDKPWQGVGIGAAIGLVLGLLLARR